MVSGFIWDRDFPEAKELKDRNDLGMSMELADVYVDDEDEEVWNLTKFRFTGATILRKDAAAYSKTSLAAQGNTIKPKQVIKQSLAAKTATREEGNNNNMSDKKKVKEKVAAARRDTGGESALMIQAIGSQLTTALQDAKGKHDQS